MAEKNKAAVELARLRNEKLSAEQRKEIASKGGLVGGVARAEALTPKQRSAIAKKAAAARWGNKAAAKKATAKKRPLAATKGS